MKQYSAQITLTVLGPLLTASTGVEQYGLQKAFHRNSKNEPVIPASHIKGKLRVALEELAKTHADKEGEFKKIKNWFGRRSDDNPQKEGYEPAPGMLQFSDFSCGIAASPQTHVGQTEKAKDSSEYDDLLRRRSRIAIHAKARTAAKNQLREVEDHFKSGAEVQCLGNVTVYAENLDNALQLTRELQAGFAWLATLGAEKGVGFGRLQQTRIDLPKEKSPVIISKNQKELGEGSELHLRIRPEQPIMVGGVKSRRTNFVTSEKVLSGGLVKGALVAGLNRGHGISPSHRELSAEYAGAFPGFENLVTHFENIRITHAFPALTNNPRPVTFPISAVKCGEHYADTALYSDPFPLLNNEAPQYFIDWKTGTDELATAFGYAKPKEVFVTRTEIDDESRRAQERNLYTYSYCCPEDRYGRPIEWICNVDFGDIADPAVRKQVKIEFFKAVELYLDRLGKRNSPVEVDMGDGHFPAAQGCSDLIRDGLVIVTLQTDAIMLSPEQVKPGENLKSLYAALWAELSRGENDAAQPGLELLDFYAHQTFKGGYIYHRYLGMIEKQTNPKSYYPYYLTCAGSVFKLTARDETKARACLEKWLRCGLELPTWARDKYGRTSTWKSCPFIPQNGFGEIAVNLNWHWDRRI